MKDRVLDARPSALPAARAASVSFRAPIAWAGELTGGTAGAVASLALALSLGLLAFAPLGPKYAYLGVLAGFASAIYGQLIAGLAGGTTHPGSGPRASASLILGSLVAVLAADRGLDLTRLHDVQTIVALAGLSVLLAGVAQLAIGGLGAGVFARYVPYPFVAGFMVGVAARIIIAQIPPLTGITLAAIAAGPLAALRAVEPATLAVGLATAGTIWLSGRRWPRVPSSLVGLIAGTLLYYAIHAAFPSARLGHVVGTIPAVFPTPAALAPLLDVAWGSLRVHALDVVSTAGVLAVVCTLDTLFAAVSIDHSIDGRHEARREVIAHGWANLVAGACGGVPVVLSRARAMASWNAGGRTRTTVVVAALLLALALAFGRDVLAIVPVSVLGGVMVVLGVGLIDSWTHGLVRRVAQPGANSDRTLFWSIATVAAVAVTTVLVGFVSAMAVGIVMSGMLFFIGMNRSLVRRIVDGSVRPSRRVWGDEDAARVQAARARIRVIDLEGALFFASAERLSERVEPLAGAVDAVVLDFRHVTAIDATGALVLERLVRRLGRKGTRVLLAGVTPRGRLGATLIAHGTFGDEKQRLWFRDCDQAMEWAERAALQRTGPSTQGEIPVAGFALFGGLSSGQIDTVVAHLQRREFSSGAALFQEGDPGDRIFLLARGAVEISIATSQSHRVRIVTMAKGSLLGEAALLDGRPRSASATAVEDCVAYEFTRDALATLSRQEPAIAIALLTNLARTLSVRMRETNEILRKLEETGG